MSRESGKKFQWLVKTGSANECKVCRTELKHITRSALRNHSNTDKHKNNLQEYEQSSSSIQSTKISQTNRQTVERAQPADINVPSSSLKRSQDSDQDSNAGKKNRAEHLSPIKYIYNVYLSSEIMEIPIKLEYFGRKFLNMLNKEMTLKFGQMLSEDLDAKPFSLIFEINISKDDIKRMGIIIRYVIVSSFLKMCIVKYFII